MSGNTFSIDYRHLTTDYRLLSIVRCPLSAELCGTGSIGGVHAALGAKPLYVNLSLEHLRRELVTLCLGQQCAVLIDEALAAEYNILCALAIAATAIDVATDGTCALLCEETL